MLVLQSGPGVSHTLSMSYAGTSRPGEMTYGFPTGDLTLAGEYAVTADFTETRAELTRLLTKKTAVLRSSASTFQVLLQSWHGSNGNLRRMWQALQHASALEAEASYMKLT